MKKGFDYLLELQCASDPVFAAFVRIWDSIDIPDSKECPYNVVGCSDCFLEGSPDCPKYE